MPEKNINIKRRDISSYPPEILDILLRDRTSKKNIIWATKDYQQFGDSYKAECEIKSELLVRENAYMIQPRVMKSQMSQLCRRKEKAEVFTPAWICNAQNNQIDNVWFGRTGIFNIECYHSWKINSDKICFADKGEKTWKKYVESPRMEIACGEAPYIVSRYDVVNGRSIPVEERIGLLDRKLRVINENIAAPDEWYGWVKRAYQSVYGFEFQGDSLLIARENLLFTYIEYLSNRWDRTPTVEELKEIAMIISWNLWQMDGLKFTVPYGDVSGDNRYCIIKDWKAARWKKKAIKEYYSLVN